MFPLSRRIWTAALLTPSGWRAPAALDVDERGVITAVHADAPEAWRGQDVLRLDGPVVPGLPNLHSHAFQRALCGRTEVWTAGGDDFWSWRELMYRLALALSPEEHEAIATALYVEMLEAGMTGVAEFHYLHHDPRGQPYADPATMSLGLLAAAATAGIELTLLPVLYVRGGFGRPPTEGQRRFVHADADGVLALLDALAPHCDRAGVTLGLAPHSLRAVDPDNLRRAVDGLWARRASAPVHVHVAEQTAEVEQCLAHLGARPVQWLLDHHAIDARWCLVHATHLEPAERARLAASGAVAGLCPTTEANLGDGVFPAREYLAEGGAFGVGSDSHATVSAAEELRLLEYGQRLVHRRRNVLGDAATPQLATRLWAAAVQGGARALGRSSAGVEVGAPADLVQLDPQHPRLRGHGAETALAAAVFGSADRPVAEVVARGRHVVRGGRHVAHAHAWARFSAAMGTLLARA